MVEAWLQWAQPTDLHWKYAQTSSLSPLHTEYLFHTFWAGWSSQTSPTWPCVSLECSFIHLHLLSYSGRLGIQDGCHWVWNTNESFSKNKHDGVRVRLILQVTSCYSIHFWLQSKREWVIIQIMLSLVTFWLFHTLFWTTFVGQVLADFWERMGTPSDFPVHWPHGRADHLTLSPRGWQTGKEGWLLKGNSFITEILSIMIHLSHQHFLSVRNKFWLLSDFFKINPLSRIPGSLDRFSCRSIEPSYIVRRINFWVLTSGSLPILTPIIWNRWKCEM